MKPPTPTTVPTSWKSWKQHAACLSCRQMHQHRHCCVGPGQCTRAYRRLGRIREARQFQALCPGRWRRSLPRACGRHCAYTLHRVHRDQPDLRAGDGKHSRPIPRSLACIPLAPGSTGVCCLTWACACSIVATCINDRACWKNSAPRAPSRTHRSPCSACTSASKTESELGRIIGFVDRR